MRERSRKLVIRGHSIELKDGTIESVLWLLDELHNYIKLNIKQGMKLNLLLGATRCIRCSRIDNNLIDGLCSDCEFENIVFQSRKNCLYGKVDDKYINSCIKKKPSCGVFDNTIWCFQRYILYIGRIGGITKIGISRKNRKGGYLTRLIEQGLQEAIVVDDKFTLKEAVNEEKWFLSIGMKDRIYTLEKVNEFQSDIFMDTISADFDDLFCLSNHQQCSSQLSQIWTPNLLKEKYPDAKIIHHCLYPQIDLPQQIEEGNEKELHGTVFRTIGDILILRNTDDFQYYKFSNLINREIIRGNKLW